MILRRVLTKRRGVLLLLLVAALALAIRSADAAFISSTSPITIDGSFSDWGTTGSPATGVGTFPGRQ
jgi:hypothetical protein